MKKAKIFLTALSVLAVVGGALAFKAKTAFHYAPTCDLQKQVCTIDDFFSFATTLNGNLPATYQVYGAFCDETTPCTTLTKISD